jgi:hypothetical protein
MRVTLTYKGPYEEVQRAVEQANAMLQSDRLLEIIESRTKPFDDCKPENLSPKQVAAYFKNAELALTVTTYRTKKTIGGYFIATNPTIIHVNLNNLPHRDDCETAAMLVHECVHALSHQVHETDKTVSFSHSGPRSGNDDTAPYWIQQQVQAELCKKPVTNDVIEVAALDNEDQENAFLTV